MRSSKVDTVTTHGLNKFRPVGHILEEFRMDGVFGFDKNLYPFCTLRLIQ